MDSVTNAVGDTVQYRYDMFGRVNEMEDAAGNTYTFTYDLMDRVTEVTDPKENTTRYQRHTDAIITFVGHSKGGAEAAANAVLTNKNAILFNPATVNLGAYVLNASDYAASKTAYIVKGDLLNILEGWFSKPIGNVEYLPT